MTPPAITDAEERFFREQGYLVIRGLLRGEELRAMREATQALVDAGARQVLKHPDYMYAKGHKSGQPVLQRIEYVIDKQEACRVLLGHPYVLRSVEKLQGRDFIPTWDAMVLKMPGEGIIVPWHQDAATGSVGDHPIFNVDFYLDQATLGNCLWAYPGSHRWDKARVEAVVRRPGFATDGATPIPMEPGDVMFHDILLVHGSPASEVPALRRVVYYEFRTAHVELEHGPHVPAYVPAKQRVLMACLERRARAPCAAGEEPFVYRPPAAYPFGWSPGTELDSYMVRHEHFWRT